MLEYEECDRIDGLEWHATNIAVIPRGHRWVQHGRSFVSLSGAPSIDFEERTQGIDWWPEEAISAADVAKAEAGGVADIFLSHDAPDFPYCTDNVQQIIDENPNNLSTVALAYAATGRALITQAIEAIQPRLHFHGHYHVEGFKTPITYPAINDGQAPRTGEAISLADGTGRGTLVRLDLDDLTWRWL